MKKRTKIALLIGGGLLLATPPSLYLAAPSVARWYVLKNYPDVKSVGDIGFGTEGVTVTDVVVERPGIKARVESVYATYEKHVWINGGTVEVDLDAMEMPKKSGGGQGSGIVINAENLSVSVKKGKLLASLAPVRVSPKEVCFDHGVVGYGKFQDVKLEEGCYDRKTKAVSLKKAALDIGLPFKLPKVETRQRVELAGISTELNSSVASTAVVTDIRLFNQEETKPHTKLHNIKISIQEQVVKVIVDSVSTNHSWFHSGPPNEYMTANHLFLDLPMGILNGHRDQNIVLSQGNEDGLTPVNVTINPARWRFAAERAPCAAWLRAVPGGADFMDEKAALNGMPPVPGWKLVEGELGFEVQVKPKPKLKLHYSCQLDCRHPAIAALKKKFTYTAYDRDNKPFERTVDRNGPEWTPLRALPPHIPKAFITFEDPYFEHHRGVMQSALFNSLKQNLTLGRFHRGGSTITMQLAKNLWLGRQKTIGRKAHEIMLAGMIEGCFSKSQILELYINIVEFGKDLYGIGPAARHYFDKYPFELEPDEAFWLARILPRPKTARPPEDGGLERVRKLMAKLAKEEIIPMYLVTGEDPMTGEEDDDDLAKEIRHRSNVSD